MQISVKGLAQFMYAGPARQRTVLRNHKFPAAAKPLIAYYNEARNAIRKYHENGNDAAILAQSVDDLRKQIAGAKPVTARRLENNILALKSYMRYFQNRKFTVLSTPKIKYHHGNVSVSAAPDLMVEENGQKEIIKLDCNRLPSPEKEIEVILQTMYEAASAAELGVKPKHVIHLDAHRDVQRTGAVSKRRLKRDIDAACENIEALWEGIKK